MSKILKLFVAYTGITLVVLLAESMIWFMLLIALSMDMKDSINYMTSHSSLAGVIRMNMVLIALVTATTAFCVEKSRE
jgi:hypothetical protein